jgi:DNA repair photolyase
MIKHLEFQEYKVRKIVNVHHHTDSWFWDKYSAVPYVGCRSGCEFCYLRGGTYLGRRDPNGFDSQIRVKINAPERLRKELARLDPDVIACGDWQQPVEDRYRLSRAMLEVVCDLQFPLLVIERSPLITRDLDLLVEINRRAWVGVIFSFSYVDRELKRVFEPRSPGLNHRLEAMEKLAGAGIQVGTALMPVIPWPSPIASGPTAKPPGLSMNCLSALRNCIMNAESPVSRSCRESAKACPLKSAGGCKTIPDCSFVV